MHVNSSNQILMNLHAHIELIKQCYLKCIDIQRNEKKIQTIQ